MVVYKALNLYQGWTKGGPRGTVYDITPNGWFHSRTFQRWYFEVLLMHIHSMDSEGPFAVIGDNLGSHFSPEVIMSTIEENIRLITLPPNATHLCQPLDVCVFRGLKQNWRKIVDKWRRETRKKGSTPKEHLPTLLNLLLASMYLYIYRCICVIMQYVPISRLVERRGIYPRFQ